jgi:acyl-coenzyme A synthetase/AMP-(fatty) acid ligase
MEPALNPMAAAAFMPDEMRSGEAALLIEMRAARTVLPDPDKVRQQIAQAVAGTFGIKLLDVELVDRGTLPRTSSGKIRRREAAALYRLGAANAACA